MLSDIEISQNKKPLNISEVAKKIGLIKEDLYIYKEYVAKIKEYIKKDTKRNLILVTAINPTPYGEGKTTVSIGLYDAFCKLGLSSLLALREPSLGPVFGVKGGATGGGYSQVIPMEDINLHFTGDFHAITSANNLLCSAIDNHIYFGNNLNIDPNTICFKRCMDLNDRALREIKIDCNNKFRNERSDGFNITAASEIMAIFCLSKDLTDLKNKLDNILIGFTYDKKPVYASSLEVTGSMVALLKDAMLPNLVQTLEENPVLIHGGPFANIAHGCNSVIATNTALDLADYTITEAGFGADLGALKFIDIKCRNNNLKPNCVVLVATVKALKYNGNVKKEDILKPDIESLKEGLSNLGAHINNIKKFNLPIVVCINKYNTDTIDEIREIENYCRDNNVIFETSEAYSKGGEGAINLAKKVVSVIDNKKDNDFKMLYDVNDNIISKIENICKNIYHAGNINFSDIALKKIELLETIGKDKLPICIAKTQYSISDDPKKLGNPTDYELNVKDIEINSGAGFIVVITGDIIRMPGLPKEPAYKKINVKDNKITGVF